MIVITTYKELRPVGTFNAASNYDPTRTLTLRNRFVRDLNKRFNQLKAEVRRAVIEQDVFGLTTPPSPVNLARPARRAFAFPRSSDKMEAFMRWLQGEVDRGILETVSMQQMGRGAESAWTNTYISDTYQRGVQRAQYEMSRAGILNEDRLLGGLDASMSTPFHVDRLGLAYTRTYEGLKGITTQMSTQISQVLAQGLADGDNPVTLARKLRAVIDGTGMGQLGITDSLGRFIPAQRRAAMLARTEVIRAHHGAMVQEYRNWGLEGVRVKAEWTTAGYNVCPQCLALEGKVFTLDQIQGMIPLHPNCRCIALPMTGAGEEPIQSVETGDVENLNHENYLPPEDIDIEYLEELMEDLGFTNLSVLDAMDMEAVRNIAAVHREIQSKFKIPKSMKLKMGVADDNTIMAVSQLHNELHLNKMYFGHGRMRGFAAESKAWAESRWHAGLGRPVDTIYHEYAHIITKPGINMKTQFYDDLSIVFDKYKADLSSFQGAWRSNPNLISGYASSPNNTLYEFAAECFSMVAAKGKEASPFAKEVYRLIEKYYKL